VDASDLRRDLLLRERQPQAGITEREEEEEEKS
jgi:hypothetical protein